MTLHPSRKYAAGFVALLAAALPQGAWACSVCFGQTDSAMAKGLNVGVLVLLAVVLFVLGGFAALFVFLARRAGRGPGSADAIWRSRNTVPLSGPDFAQLKE